MNLVAFCGASGAGKTTLIEGVIAALKNEGLRVSVIKHAHEGFEIDRPGKDSWRHARAGAFEVVVASALRLAKLREFERRVEPDLHALLGELSACDWVLAEGFKHAEVMKIEVWRDGLDALPVYPDDPFVAAIVTDDAAKLPVATARPVFGSGDAQAVADYLLAVADRFEYKAPLHV